MGSKHGRFEMTYPHGDRYRGDFRNGQRHGRGVYESARGDRYEGMWVDDMRHGHGLFTFTQVDPKGAKWAGSYEGEWVRDQKHGKGVFSYPNGDKYDGQWLKGKKTGPGIYIYANGDRYLGEFMNDDMHGKGMMIFANGDRLEGHWEHDLLHGDATFTALASKKQFKQQFDKGEKLKDEFIGVVSEMPAEPPIASVALRNTTAPSSVPLPANGARPVAPQSGAAIPKSTSDDLGHTAMRAASPPAAANEVDDLINEVKQQREAAHGRNSSLVPEKPAEEQPTEPETQPATTQHSTVVVDAADEFDNASMEAEHTDS